MSNDEKRRRVGILRIGEQAIRGFFDLPEGYELVSVWADPETRSIKVMVRSDELDVVDEWAQPPDLSGGWRAEYLVDPEGRDKLWYRMRWDAS